MTRRNFFMKNEVQRSFSPFQDSSNSETDYDYWFRRATGSEMYVQVSSDTPTSGAIAMTGILPNQNALKHRRLLGAAIFDEASYGRGKFHHRSAKEYLAACWIEKKLKEGLPISQALSLFSKWQYGHHVLIDSRRPILCWLAAMNAKVRQHVIQHFPKMLMFDRLSAKKIKMRSTSDLLSRRQDPIPTQLRRETRAPQSICHLIRHIASTG